MLAALRIFWLVVEAALDHLASGLAYPIVLAALWVGWRRWSPLWLSPLILAEAFYAAERFSAASGVGKLPGAMSNPLFQAMSFALLALIGGLAGRALGRRRQ